MALLNFRRGGGGPQGPDAPSDPGIQAFLDGYSIEVMPRTAARIDDFRTLLPTGTRICIAHIEGTPIADMVATASRLAADGFQVMPHFPARIIADQAMLADWIARYQGEAGINSALVLAGGLAQPLGAFSDSMQLLRTGLFEKAGFNRIHVAGHPEGNRDIDPDGSIRNVMQALHWKQEYARDTGIDMAIVTQFAFAAAPIIAWADMLRKARITLPVHIGIAGPARLQTLIRFAIACGVGPSLKVLQKRARDVTRLMLPFEPTEVITELAAHKAAHPDFAVERVHFFPLGGIRATADWAIRHGGPAARPALTA